MSERLLSLKKSTRFMQIIIAITCIIIFTMLSGCGYLVNRGALLIIENQADEQIHDARIQYTSSKEKIEIGILKSKESFKHKINNQQEDSITLFFTDSIGTKHEETAVGYIIKGMKGTVTVVIKKDEAGKWMVVSN